MALTAQPWWSDWRIEFDPHAREAHLGDVLVGLGDPALPQGGIALTQKFEESAFRSVAEYVRHAPPALVALWQQRCEAAPPAARRLVLEDLSLDSCFALLLFGRLLGGELLPPATEAWCAYVTRWEEGYTRQGVAPQQSIAQLLTTLGHSYFAIDDSGTVPGVDVFADGARACLSLLEQALAQGRAPDALDIAALPHSDALARAQSHLDYELERYQRALRHGRTCQLAVPLSRSGRRLLVDALFIEEQVSSGLLKVFARNDRDSSWTGRGYEVLGVHRPSLRGTGNDMVISVSKESGLSLQDLWKGLEQRETLAWDGQRPNDQPRRITSYQDKAAPPNQPWWDDGGQYTLIAAPKSLGAAHGNAAGTRLHWHDDVLAEVWACYSPIPKGLQFAAEPALHDKHFAVCRWPAGMQVAETAAAVTDCPTFCAWLKALSTSAANVRSVNDLAAERSYRLVPFDGGCAVLHHDGVTVFDDWTAAEVPIAEMRLIFSQMVEAGHDLKAFRVDADHFSKSLGSQRQLLKHSSFDRRRFEEWKDRLWAARTRLLQSSGSALGRVDPWPLNEFRASLSQVMGVGEHHKETLETLDQIDRVTSAIGDHLREKRLRGYRAAAAGLAVGFALKECVEQVQSVLVANLYDWQLALVRNEQSLQWLKQQAHAMELWERASMGAALLGLVLGFLLSWRYDAPKQAE